MICMFKVMHYLLADVFSNFHNVFYNLGALFIGYLAAPRPTLEHCRGGSVTNPMLIAAFVTSLTRRPPGASY